MSDEQEQQQQQQDYGEEANNDADIWQRHTHIDQVEMHSNGGPWMTWHRCAGSTSGTTQTDGKGKEGGGNGKAQTEKGRAAKRGRGGEWKVAKSTPRVNQGPTV